MKFLGVASLALAAAAALGACGSPPNHGASQRVPTLGFVSHRGPRSGRGWGEVRPPVVYNGGDATGLVTSIRWSTWGGPRAIGRGEGWYVSPTEDVSQGHQLPTTVVAFDRGTCDGHRVYRDVEWYFPSTRETFNPYVYETYCGSLGYSAAGPWLYVSTGAEPGSGSSWPYPTGIQVDNVDGFSGLLWRMTSPGAAVATGVYSYDTCARSCAGGPHELFPVTLRAGAPATCTIRLDDLQTGSVTTLRTEVFTRLTIVWGHKGAPPYRPHFGPICQRA